MERNGSFEKIQSNRRLAWKVFKFLIENDSLLDQKKYQELYEKTKEIIIKFHKEYNRPVSDEKTIEHIIITLARLENRTSKENFELTNDVEKHILDI